LSAPHLDRLQQATQAELECWADRVLDARAASEVFDV